jgi:hypothetical protein
MRKHRVLIWLCIITMLALSLACDFFSTPIPPEMEWDSSPSALIVEAVHNNGFPAGLGEDGFTLNYIPHTRVYGDGRIIWVTDLEGPRTVMQGKLDEERMTSLLWGIKGKGFFEWKAMYSPLFPLDNPPFDVLKFNLRSLSHQVRVSGNPPDGFYTLLSEMRNGAGAQDRSVYVPEKGFLTVHSPSTTFSDSLPIWQADELGFSLAAVENGKYINGAALEFVWTQINRYPYYPVYIQDGAQVYQVYLQIPGVSMTEPPAERPEMWINSQEATGGVTDSPENTVGVVSGTVLVEDGNSAMGGIAGDTIDATVTFTAESTAGEVTEMRVKIGCYQEALNDAVWEPFVSQKSYPVHVILNWTGWGVSVQYRDTAGNVSPTYCDDISVEGMPKRPAF